MTKSKKNSGNSPHVVAIIQARMGSQRLPGKTLAEIAGKPLLDHVITRTKACKAIQTVVVATSNKEEDKQVIQRARVHGVDSFTGSADDVLDRFYHAAQRFDADVIVRITADDPFIDPAIVDGFVNYFLSQPELDFLSDDESDPTFPEGMAVSVIAFKALQRAWHEASLPSEREHLSPYMTKNPHRFFLGTMANRESLGHYRFTLDYPEDLHFTREIYEHLHHKGMFLLQDIVDLLRERPQLMTINQNIERNHGYKLSLLKEQTEPNNENHEDWQQ